MKRQYQVITYLQEQWTSDPEEALGGVVRKSTPDGSRQADSSRYFQRNPRRRIFVVSQSGKVSFIRLIMHSRNNFCTRFWEYRVEQEHPIV